MGLLQQVGHGSVTVQWPALYASADLVGKGTVLQVSDHECLVAGTMPVSTGILLKVWISPPNRADALYVREARVVWARKHEFGLEMTEVDADDRQWLLRFVQQC